MTGSADHSSGYYAHFHTITRVLLWRQLLWGAAFYGSYILLTRYFLDKLHYSEADTLMILGAFGAAGPVFSAIGGFVADRYIGSFRAIYIGYSVYAIGFFLLGVGAYSLDISLSIFSIALIGYARGLSSSSPTVLLGNSCLDQKELRFEQALTINYTANNLGSFSARYFFPFMVVWSGYHGNFFLSAGIMAINLLLLFIFRKKLIATGNAADGHPVGVKVWIVFIAGSCFALGSLYWLFFHFETGKYVIYGIGILAIAYFVFEMSRASMAYRFKMGSVLIVIFILMVFYFYYGQMNTSMNIYAINLMDDQLLGFIPFKPESSSAFNPLWCCLLGSPLAFAYQWLEKQGVSPSIPSKFAVAFVFTAVAFFLLGLSARYIGENGKIAAEWMLVVHLFQAIAELIVGALGAGFIFEMVPQHLSAFAIGMKSVALSLSSIVAAVISTKIALPDHHVLSPDAMSTVYSGYFLNLAVFAVIMAGMTLVLSRVITRLIKKGKSLEQEQPLKPLEA